MNSGESEASLIGIDWGTSSMRAYLIGAQGEVLDRSDAPDGIMHVPGKDFETVLVSVLDPWMQEATIPVITSGMITSRNGWLETPYLSTPLGASHLAEALVPLTTQCGWQLHCIAGVTKDLKGIPDVMRGEETQIAGALEAGMDNRLFVLPGTHSKWITVQDGHIENFETVMSGEIFEALRRHTILGTLMQEAAFSAEGFRAGVAAGNNAGQKLLQALFSVRTLPLFGHLEEGMVADYLSGMLIGAEIKGATHNKPNENPIAIIGRKDLAERYAIALDSLGFKSIKVEDDVVAKGYFNIATTAGLLE